MEKKCFPQNIILMLNVGSHFSLPCLSSAAKLIIKPLDGAGLAKQITNNAQK